MSNPFAVQPGGVIQGPPSGIAQGLAGVLAQMQIQRENQFRMQELAQQQAQQQALQQYYESQAMLRQQELNQEAGEAALKRAGMAQVGAAQRAALTDPSRGLPGQLLEAGAQAVAPYPNLSSVFGGVSNENLPAAVKGVQDVQALTPKAPEPPTSGKEEQYYRYLLTVDPRRAALYKTLWLDKMPQTIVNVGAGETQFSKSLAEARVGVLKESGQQARGAAARFPALSEAYDRADKALTGLTANVGLGVARTLSALGVASGKDAVANTQIFQRLTGEGAFSYLKDRDLGSGSGVTDSDREFALRLAAGQITLDRASIKKILRINAGVGLMKMQEGIADLKRQAITYESEAPSLLRDAADFKQKARPMWKRYAKMLVDEGVPISDIRERLITADIDDPEQILRSLPKQSDKQLIDSLFPKRR